MTEALAQRLDTAAAWGERAAGGYDRLGWVTAKGPLDKMVKLAALQGHETVVDAATGSGAVLDALAPHLKTGKIIGFDLSPEMMSRRPNPLPDNASLHVASIYETALQTDSIDVITARQVFHNLPDIPSAVSELGRTLKPGGRFIVCEYVPVNSAVQRFEKPIFEKKEAGRHLLTGEELAESIANPFLAEYHGGEVRLEYAMLPQYSVEDWMKNSGLPGETQRKIVSMYQRAPLSIQRHMNATFTPDGDVFVDRPFAFVVAQKPTI